MIQSTKRGIEATELYLLRYPGLSTLGGITLRIRVDRTMLFCILEPSFSEKLVVKLIKFNPSGFSNNWAE